MTADSVSGPQLARRPLRTSAAIELVSLAVLLVNIATADARHIAALFGPVHGIAWLFGVLAACRDPQGSSGIALRAVTPGIGGLLALRALRRADARLAQGPGAVFPGDGTPGPSTNALARTRWYLSIRPLWRPQGR